MKRYRRALGYWEYLLRPRFWWWVLKDPRRWVVDVVPNLLGDLKEFAQRGMYGFADSDIPELGPYLCNVMSPAMSRYRDWHWAHPGDLTEQEWNNILTTMAAAWEARRKIFDDLPPSMEHQAILDWEDELEETANYGLRLFAEHVSALWY